ncbi:MAG: pyridoxamine 5'-phosphate oxidase family protein [Bryobacteraceae bacterium]|nr:pyridoxamine 5'-phosphate oxidase family protein [Bryobacteraceae bacterium]
MAITVTEAAAFLHLHRYAALSTISGAGPQSAVVGIALTGDFEILFDTLTSTRKYANLRANPSAALLVWTGQATLQLEGDAREIAGAELEQRREVYFAKFPDGRERAAWPGIAYFAFQTRWLRFSDFSLDPPRIEELRLP